jgi:hypothetical protein
MTISTEITPKSAPPDWVKEMHKHFQKYGFYRAEDLHRALGDPNGYVEVRTSAMLPVNLFIAK